MNLDTPYKAPEYLSDIRDCDALVDRDRLRSIAQSLRQLNLAVLLYLGTMPISLTINSVGKHSALGSALLGIYILVVLVLGVIGIYRLASILRGPVVAIIYVLGLLVPIFGLLLLLALNGKATQELRNAGIKVGLLGADVKSI